MKMNTTELKALADRLERNHMPASEAKAMMPVLKDLVLDLIETREELHTTQVKLARVEQERDRASDQLADDIAFNASMDRLELEMQEEPYPQGEPAMEGFQYE